MVLASKVSLAEFLAIPEEKPYLELMDGDVFETPMAGDKHGTLVAELARLLGNYLVGTREARVVSDVRHLERDEEWLFLPDVSVTLRSRKGPAVESEGPVEVLPDLAIEVLSPDDRPGRVQRRIGHYMRSGVPLLWVIDPDEERLTAWSPGNSPLDFSGPAKVSALPVLKDFELDLGELFGTLRD